MAYVKQNIFVNGLSGTIAKQMTLKVRKGKTVVCVKRGPDTLPPTMRQLVARDKFEDALSYAREAIADPIKKLMYAAAAKGGQTAYNVAFKDAATFPKIVLIDTKQYSGTIGDVITLAVKNVVCVQSVKVRLLSATGIELEEGEAVPGDRVSYWRYATTLTNPTLKGTRILVTATDLPGNVATAERESR
ncbi:hypothetical protein [Chitinophaga sp. S165]|uniref:hypothetical protein n=1 Tax=Chitinophaga sp. S165 TaxID=2135462 RepID=UPI000D716920|nr:hypothetical protein [Chitinophaga sp. S165]PWV49693.1 hypothetical protein C7475_105201 [Chitinophaga sp. S165]